MKARCVFQGYSQEYTYNVPDGLDVQIGKLVVVPAGSGNKLEVVKVSNLFPEAKPGAECKWIVDVVDEAAHELRMRTERKRVVLQKQLDDKLRIWMKDNALNLMLQNDCEALLIKQQLDGLSSS